jgi:hypothetical protein
MILHSGDVPSKGRWSGKHTCALRPLTFMEIINYNSLTTGSKLKDLIRDIEVLEEMDESILKFSLYDLEYLIFMMKVITITDDIDFRTTKVCKHCGTESLIQFSLADFKFIDVKKLKEIKAIRLRDGEFNIKMPTIGEFKFVLDKYKMYSELDSLDAIKIISLFKDFKEQSPEIEHAVLNATREDITALSLVEQTYLNNVEVLDRKCEHCDKTGGMVMRIDDSITSMFRGILQNNPPTEDQILFE